MICSGNPGKMNRFRFFAAIVQKIAIKIGAMPIVDDGQRNDENFMAELFCQILGIHVSCNIDDLDKVFGKSNQSITEYPLIYRNESPESNEKVADGRKIKSILTKENYIPKQNSLNQIEIANRQSGKLFDDNKQSKSRERREE
jgi:hypothetical protein